MPTFSANERAPSHSLTALTLLADPVSILLDRGRLVAVADVAFSGDEQQATRDQVALLHDCARELRWLRSKLKQAFTAAYAWGGIDAASTQRLIDRFELWSD
jgi:hypothetical protein